ncbi:MAG TPA: hypothetical protein ENI17_12330 [Pseudomonas xinjiangensis]|uniref:Uncharacterized protein n=2 Tax=root TaxID=1 RepID=A0A7V1FRN1_9GAMM|nr:hypothetical protein [Halopseudomonas xinjiangensis]HEC48399.1 hypothetical protein [Halopseudomonas xinjiangensis]
MTALSEDKKGARVKTPLHLLQTLTRTLNEHLCEACQHAEEDARKALEKLSRQHAKLDGKLAEAKEKLASRQGPESDGKSIAKAQSKVSDLETALKELEQARDSSENYIKQLQSDIRQTLRLAKGFERIDGQVTQALEKRSNPAAATDNKPRSGPRRKRARSAAPNPSATA